MGYIEKNLMPGEEVTLKAKISSAIFIWPIVFALVGVVLMFSSAKNNALLCFGLLVLLLGLILIVQAIIVVSTTEFAVTDKRVIAKAGLLRRHSLEILLAKIESINVNQSLWGRIFNYGTLVVVGTGGTKEKFPSIAKSAEFKQRINTQIAGIK